MAFGLDNAVLTEAIRKLDQRRRAAEKAVTDAAKRVGDEPLGQNLLDLMERRWNGSFSSIGQFLSKKRSADDDE
jgi:hypothetical protein